MVEYTNNVYKDLIQQYKTWPELRDYLCVLGLSISDEKDPYCIIRSKTVNTTETLSITKWFRSTVWDTVAHRPVSIAPPKASTTFPFVTCQEIVANGVLCQEFLDGFMINYFITATNEKIITTRSKLGGTGHFYSTKSFHDLFLEAAGSDLDELIGADCTKGERSVSYSFLVQHQEHRVVTPITENKIFLVQKTTLLEDGTAVIEDGFESFLDRPNVPTISVGEEGNSNECLQRFFADKSWEFQGVVFKDACGNRWRFRNEAYVNVKALRGNSASHVERFTQLYRQNLIVPYLEYYPLESYTFVYNNIFMNMIHQTVYNHYVKVHITKVSTMNEVEPQYRRHVWALHKYYATTLRPQKKKITYNEVAYYFFQLPWQVLAHLLRTSQDSYFSLMSEVVSQ